MLSFLDGLVDVDDIAGAIEEAFPRRVAVGSTSNTVSPTGDLVPGALNMTPGLESVPSVRRDALADEPVNIGGADHKTATHIWTLQGAWYQIKAGQLLVEEGTGDRYEILMRDVHALGIHTNLKTMQVTQ